MSEFEEFTDFYFLKYATSCMYKAEHWPLIGPISTIIGSPEQICDILSFYKEYSPPSYGALWNWERKRDSS